MLILFSLDPDNNNNNTTKQNNRDIATSDDKFNKNKTNSKIQNDKHLCPECKSDSLTFESLSIYEGKQTQLINCKTCGLNGKRYGHYQIGFG